MLRCWMSFLLGLGREVMIYEVMEITGFESIYLWLEKAVQA